MENIRDKTSRRGPGFTLVEILIVVCVITVLIGLTANATASARQKAYASTATTEAEQIASAFKAYRLSDKDGEWPFETGGQWKNVTKTDIAPLLGGNGKPVLLDVSDGQFDDDEFRDPWGNAYQVRTYQPSKEGAGEAGNEGEAGNIVLKTTIEVVVSFPNQFDRYYDYDVGVPYVDPAE